MVRNIFCELRKIFLFLLHGKKSCVDSILVNSLIKNNLNFQFTVLMKQTRNVLVSIDFICSN